ncbi:hypothetical protein [Ponticaulis koreensis]|uniref:hypothetical protein n=1 Tax=Ponticaulis koreensis TaxID=1123045 RepID=UPI0012DF9D0A|nr:hypothetical protein [Ponticaulis koreensis]
MAEDLQSYFSEVRLGPFRKGMVLADRHFDRTVFKSTQGALKTKGPHCLRDVHFERCEVEAGPFWLGEGYELENVHFDKLKVWRFMFDNRTKMRHVRASSLAKANRFEIQPGLTSEKEKDRQIDDPEFSLDVSGYQGDLQIWGVPADRVAINPETQIRLRHPTRERHLSQAIGLTEHGLWSIALDQIVGRRVRDAVLSLPKPKDRDYADQMRDIELLRSEGIAF